MRKFICVLCGVGTGIFLFHPVPCPAAERTDKIVAVINSDVITDDELRVFMKVAELEFEELPSGDPEEIRSSYLDRLIEDKLILQEAQRMGMRAHDGAIEDRVKDMKLRAGSEHAFERALSAQGISMNELRRKLSDQFLVYSAVQREVKQKVVVSPREVTEYYEAHPEMFASPETAVVDSIFVEDAGKALEVREQLLKQEDFEEVAKENSRRSNLGAVQRGQFKKELEDFIFGLKAGEPSEPFAVAGGFYIFVLREIKAPSSESLGTVKDKVLERLEIDKMEKMYREWIERLKDKAYISVREE